MSEREGWSTGEDGDVELLDDAEAVDTADTIEETWAPGEPPVDLPADEVLRVRALTEREPPADLLDVPEDASDLAAPDADAPIGDHDLDLEQAFPHTVLGSDGVETRFEELDSTEE